MSTCYHAGLVVGYRLCIKALLEKVRIRVDEESHMEARFDPRTGARLGDVGVVDQQEGWAYRWDGATYAEDPGGVEALLLSIADKVCAVHTTYGSEDLPTYAVFGLRLPERKEPDVHCRFSVGGSVLLDDLVSRHKEYRALGARLRRLGFKVSRCRAFVTVSCWPS